MRHLVLPAGTQSVLAEEVPALLARAIYPPAEDEGLPQAVGRVSAEEDHEKAARQAAILGELPVFDHAGLPTVWSPRARVRVADFIDYAARFEVAVTVADAGPKPLHEWTDEEIEKARQSGLAAARLLRVVDEGDRAMRVLDALLGSDERPTRRAERAAPTPAPAPAVGVNSTQAKARAGNAELFALARAEALKVLARYAARDLYPAQATVADEVAAELRKRGMFGADGKPLTGATIKRHALKGISSATKRAQSTTLKRGK